MTGLKWHRTSGGYVRAWGAKLFPGDMLPPYYKLTAMKRGRPPRKVELVRRGQPPQDIGEGATLADAKQVAQNDYDNRVDATTSSV